VPIEKVSSVQAAVVTEIPALTASKDSDSNTGTLLLINDYKSELRILVELNRSAVVANSVLRD
jgi:hypothetical protein